LVSDVDVGLLKEAGVNRTSTTRSRSTDDRDTGVVSASPKVGTGSFQTGSVREDRGGDLSKRSGQTIGVQASDNAIRRDREAGKRTRRKTVLAARLNLHLRRELRECCKVKRNRE